jgi:hypothetical protein
MNDVCKAIECVNKKNLSGDNLGISKLAVNHENHFFSLWAQKKSTTFLNSKLTKSTKSRKLLDEAVNSSEKNLDHFGTMGTI